MLDFVKHYWQTLPIFVIQIVVLASIAGAMQEEKRPRFLPYVFLGVYVFTCIVVYYLYGMNRLVAIDVPRWWSMLLTVLVVNLIPLVAALAAISLARRKIGATRTQVLAGIGGGVLSLPLVTWTADLFYDLLYPWFGGV